MISFWLVISVITIAGICLIRRTAENKRLGYVTTPDYPKHAATETVEREETDDEYRARCAKLDPTLPKGGKKMVKVKVSSIADKKAFDEQLAHYHLMVAKRDRNIENDSRVAEFARYAYIALGMIVSVFVLVGAIISSGVSKSDIESAVSGAFADLDIRIAGLDKRIESNYTNVINSVDEFKIEYGSRIAKMENGIMLLSKAATNDRPAGIVGIEFTSNQQVISNTLKILREQRKEDTQLAESNRMALQNEITQKFNAIQDKIDRRFEKIEQQSVVATNTVMAASIHSNNRVSTTTHQPSSVVSGSVTGPARDYWPNKYRLVTVNVTAKNADGSNAFTSRDCDDIAREVHRHLAGKFCRSPANEGTQAKFRELADQFLKDLLANTEYQNIEVLEVTFSNENSKDPGTTNLVQQR